MSESNSSSSTPEETHPPLHFLFFDLSLSNFPREEATDFLRSIPLRLGSGDTILVGFDHDNDKEEIEKTYNDSKGYTANFVFNGLRSAGRVLDNEKMADEDNWDYVKHYKSNNSAVFLICYMLSVGFLTSAAIGSIRNTYSLYEDTKHSPSRSVSIPSTNLLMVKSSLS